jgi:biotin operon repressor/predicted nucleotidyltransferase
MGTINNKQRIMCILLKDFASSHTATSLSKELKMSRWGIWKILKKLEKDQLIILDSIGTGKTSAQRVILNWNNPIADKTLSLYLTEEALKYKRWRFNFNKLEKKVRFLILFGSILHSPKEANDVDILIAAEKKEFVKIEGLIVKIKLSQEMGIHSINFTEAEFKKELKKENKACIDAIKKGVVLFGQENFIEFMEDV